MINRHGTKRFKTATALFYFGVRGVMKIESHRFSIPFSTLFEWSLKGMLCLAIFSGPALCFAVSTGQKTLSGTSVQASVMATLNTNPRLAELKQNRAAVQKDLAQTQGRYYPRVDLNLGAGTDNHSDALTRNQNTDGDWDERTEASISLVQPIYQGGELDSSVGVQSARVESADKRVLDNAEALALDAAIAHLESWRQRRLLELANQNMAAHQEILDHIQERQRAGAGSIADVLQASGRLTLTRTSRLQIMADLETALANYRRVAGHNPGKLELPIEFRSHLPNGKEDALSRVEACNPKLAAFAADIKISQYEVDVRKSSFLPRVNLELSSTYRDHVESSQTYEHNNAAMIRLRWNLYNGGSDTAARESAEARELQTRLARQDQYNQIAEQVHDTWSRYTIAGEQIKTYSEAVEYNRQTLDAYKQQFVVGHRSLLDVLYAENEFFQSSGQLITARINEMIAAYRLLALTGCLIRSLDIDVAPFEITVTAAACCAGVDNPDSDADGVPNLLDRCPNTPAGVSIDGVGCPLDSDKDGVADHRDNCQATPTGISVDRKGCPLDTDGDGVPDSNDKCPDTPAGTTVTINGCPIPAATKSATVTATGTWVYQGIKFETNKWDLKPESSTILDEIVEGLFAAPNLHVEIQGHSDNIGNRAYNIELSQKRAQAVMAYLIDNGIATARLTVKGYGPDRPLVGNDTRQGRRNNRRVELKPI